MNPHTCWRCGDSIDPHDPLTYTRVQGWERRAIGASRRGGSDIVLRERLPEYAHGSCVEKARMGVSPEQQELIA